MKIAVVGAGAMGSIFGARFSQAGHDTVLVDVAAPLVDAINADGVTIVRGEDETTTRVPATTDPASVGPVDVVVFFVKCYHTRPPPSSPGRSSAPTRSSPRSRTAGATATCSQASIPPEQVTVGVTYNSGLLQAPARVVHPAEQPTLVGSFANGTGDGPSRLAEALNDAGLEASIASPVRPEIWKKLILNAATLPTAALTGMHAGALTSSEDAHELVTDTAREAVTVAQALGYDIDADERVNAIHALLEKAGPSKASMLQDFEAGRQTEVDVINGAVVRAADETGVDVPLNRALLRLVKAWESLRGLG